MPLLPDGDPAPPDGSLPPSALADLGDTPFGIYLHVPYCRVRCGYCDFNTYAPTEWGSAGPGSWRGSTLLELDLAERVLAGGAPPASTVFFGGGTPTLLPAQDLVGAVQGIAARFGLMRGAEVSVEANPDTLDEAYAVALAEGGVTRVSIGMQSATSHVLATLDRTHNPANVARAVAAVKAAGLQVSVDLIYGTPGESLADWQRSLDAALALGPDHISAYALGIEEGTAMGAAVRRGVLPPTDPDDQAAKYELADETLSGAGFGWYEVSNWASRPDARARHNELYWRSGSWWGTGPGAHSHVGGVRWWNVKHPKTWGERLTAGLSPAAGREALTADQRYDERVLLETRLVEGIATADLRPAGRHAVAGLMAEELVDGRAALAGRVVLTRRGRLLADLVVRRLLGV